MDITGLPEQIFTADKLEAYAEANYLKGGVVYADLVTTVSPSYAREIMTQEGGEGLDGLMRARRNELFGILNGIDEKAYDPQTDRYLSSRFCVKDYKNGKAADKAAFQKRFGLPQESGMFLLGMVSRMTEQKGFELIGNMLDFPAVQREGSICGGGHGGGAL